MYIELKTARLTLRPLAASDLATVHAYAGDPENTRYMIFLPNKTEAESAAFLERAAEEWVKDAPEFFEFGVLYEGKHIGAASLYREGAGAGELGWCLNKNYWGRGLMPEAAAALIRFARDTLGLTRLVAHADSRNSASRRVMEKLGMTLEWDDGPRFYEKTGEHASECMYSLDLTNCSAD